MSGEFAVDGDCAVTNGPMLADASITAITRRRNNRDGRRQCCTAGSDVVRPNNSYRTSGPPNSARIQLDHTRKLARNGWESPTSISQKRISEFAECGLFQRPDAAIGKFAPRSSALTEYKTHFEVAGACRTHPLSGRGRRPTASCIDPKNSFAVQESRFSVSRWP